MPRPKRGRTIENRRGFPKLYETTNARYPYKVVYRKAGIQKYFGPKERAAAEQFYWKLVDLLPEVGAIGLKVDAAVRAHVAASLETLAPFPGVTILDACRDYAERHGGGNPDLTLREAKDLFLKAKLNEQIARATYDTLEKRIGGFISHAKVIRCLDVTKGIVTDWLDSKGGTARTYVNDHAALSNWFGWLVRDGQLPTNPCDGIVMPRIDDPRPRSMTVEQVWELLIEAMNYEDYFKQYGPGFMVPYFALGIFAGLRPGEIERLERSDVLLKRKQPIIQVYKGKMRSRVTRIVPIEPGLKSFLEAYPVKSYVPKRSFRSAFDRIRSRIGLKEEWQGDIMRHTYASFMLERYDIASVAKWMGDRPGTVERFYIEPQWPGEGDDFLSISMESIIGRL